MCAENENLDSKSRIRILNDVRILKYDLGGLKLENINVNNTFCKKEFFRLGSKNCMGMVFCYQNCSDLLWEKNFKFEAECQEFAKILRSLEQFIQTVKGPNNFW